MAKLTVITRQHLFGSRPGSVIVVEDSPIVRGLLARGRLNLVDPPCLEMLDGPSSVEASADQELPDKPKRARSSGSRKTSEERSGRSEENVPDSFGGHEGQSADSQDHTEGEAYRPSDS